MTTPVFWLIPILLLPGVALLIVSTAARYGQIHEELHHLQMDEMAVEPMFRQHLAHRARLFRNALVSLYVSVGAFALGSLIGALLDLSGQPSDWAVIALAFAGILCLIFAAYELIRESLLSFQVIAYHLDNLNSPEDT